MIDSHTHLSSCAPDDAQPVAAAREAGVTRILTVGMDEETWPQAIAAADAFDEVFWQRWGRHPNMAEGFDDAALETLRGLAAHPKCRAIGETGLDYFRETTTAAAQAHAFHAHIGSHARRASRSSSTPAPRTTTRSRRCAIARTASR